MQSNENRVCRATCYCRQESVKVSCRREHSFTADCLTDTAANGRSAQPIRGDCLCSSLRLSVTKFLLVPRAYALTTCWACGAREANVLPLSAHSFIIAQFSLSSRSVRAGHACIRHCAVLAVIVEHRVDESSGMRAFVFTGFCVIIYPAIEASGSGWWASLVLMCSWRPSLLLVASLTVWMDGGCSK